MSECFTSIKQLMPYADIHFVKVWILFVFRFSIIGLCHVVTVICVHEYVSVLVSELESE